MIDLEAHKKAEEEATPGPWLPYEGPLSTGATLRHGPIRERVVFSYDSADALCLMRNDHAEMIAALAAQDPRAMTEPVPDGERVLLLLKSLDFGKNGPQWVIASKNDGKWNISGSTHPIAWLPLPRVPDHLKGQRG